MLHKVLLARIYHKWERGVRGSNATGRGVMVGTGVAVRVAAAVAQAQDGGFLIRAPTPTMRRRMSGKRWAPKMQNCSTAASAQV